MIHLTNIRKQHGGQVLLDNASLQILPATRTGLVGPNGAGKTTIFRLITGEEEADKGEISCAKKTVIGYFSQDVGEMAGRSVQAEVMSAAGDLVALGSRYPGDGDGDGGTHGRGAVDRSPGTLRRGRRDLRTARRLRPRTTGPGDPHRPWHLAAGFSHPGRKIQRRLEDAHRPGQDFNHQPGRSAPRRTDQPPRYRIDPLA